VPLSRPALARILESKLRAELAAARGRSGAPPPALPPAPWPEDMPLDEGGLGADSLERLWLAGAVNEMFHLHEAGLEESLLGSPLLGDWLDRAGEALRAAGRVTFATSGSTGAPKRCAHALPDLLEEVEALAALLPGRGRVVSTVPAHHIYGFLFTALLPDRLGAPVAPAGTSLESGDLVVSFPERWLFLERSVERFPPDVTGTTSTAPCPAWLPEALAARGLAGLLEIYGSSETAGIGTRRWPDPAYTLLPHWRFAGPASGPDPDLDQSPRPLELVRRSGARATTMDGLVPEGERRFTLGGRVDGAVQVGGVNVQPAAVGARLRDHPGVRDAAVRLMRPEEGSRLKAFVVPSDPAADREALRAALGAWIDAHLAAAERPRALSFGAELPRNPMGKPADW
jgi:4-coumarate--CoA ligase (photoactive yellow protein activation family)